MVHAKSSGYRVNGFTLIEIMVVVLVISVLVAIAYPSYRQHVVKTRRAAATGCLLEQAQYMERFYTTNLQYHQDRAGNAVVLPNCSTDISDAYAISFDGAPSATSFTVRAEPQQPAQTDPKCGTLTINQMGVQTSSGSDPVEKCW